MGACGPFSRAPLLASLLAAAACLAACIELAAGTDSGDGAPRVRREPFAPRVVLSGELVAERAIEVSAPDVGVRPLEIRWIVENGTAVEAGDLLVAFDNSELAAGLEEQRIAVLRSRTTLVTTESEAGSTAAEAEFEVERRRAELDKARLEATIPPNLKSEEEYQRLQLELRKATSRLADAERALEAARAVGSSEEELRTLALERAGAELARLEDGIRQLQIVAPAAGVALLASNPREDRRLRVGDAVYPGQQLASLPDVQTMIVRARLFDVDDGLIEAGSPAAVILDPFPDRVIGARIRHLDAMALPRESQSTNHVFWVTVDLLDLDLERMRPGTSAKVIVARRDAGPTGREDPLVVPRASLDVTDPSQPRLLLADGSWRAVDLGPCEPLRCVVDSGAEEGLRLGWAATTGSGR